MYISYNIIRSYLKLYITVLIRLILWTLYVIIWDSTILRKMKTTEIAVARRWDTALII